jgi:RsiW-degrading membrane proteinase PrsW (M82 family)
MSATTPSPEANLAAAPAEVQAETRQAPYPLLATPVPPRSAPLVLGVLGIILASLALGAVGVLFLLWLGPGFTAFGAVLALIPLGVVLLGVRWIDRWEPEPRGLLIFAFLWGAGMAVAGTLIVGLTIESAIPVDSAESAAYDFASSVIVAPIVEETAKGLGVLLIFLIARRAFDGPVDGIVYAALVAGGFAFTENIEYFAIELSDPEGSISSVFFIRGILSPFAHVMFTAMTGLFIGLAAQRGGRWLGVGGFFVGLVPAILLHALWNGALFVVSDFFAYYFLVQVPLFALAVTLVVLLRRREVAITRARLSEYAVAGWFNPGELASLTTPTGRRLARAWAKSHGLGKVMSRYVSDATHLAFARERIIRGRDLIGAQADEAALLAKVTESRRALAAAVAVMPGTQPAAAAV